jgi:hypothetical protein
VEGSLNGFVGLGLSRSSNPAICRDRRPKALRRADKAPSGAAFQSSSGIGGNSVMPPSQMLRIGQAIPRAVWLQDQSWNLLLGI